MQIARLVRPDERFGIREEIALNLDLCIVERTVNDLRLERHARPALAPVIEPHAALHADLAFRNRVRILHTDRTVGIEVVMIQCKGGRL